MRTTTLMLAFILAAPAAAQTDYSKVTIQPQPLSPGITALFGSGGNIGVATGPDATILVDDEFAELTPKIIAAVKALTPAPVRFIINTHWHGDHTGGNANFGAAGVVIVAHDNVRTRMASDQFIAFIKKKVPASPAVALPVVTFGDGVTLHLNGEDIRAIHVAPAHTDGDALVVFTKANIIHMGDTYLSAGYPIVDISSGGAVAGLIAAADRGLALGNAATTYIPGHGPVTGRAGLQAYRDMVADIVGKVRAGIAAGKSLDAVVAEHPTAAYDAKWGGSFVKPDVFVQMAYTSLTGK
jgi:cyclase